MRGRRYRSGYRSDRGSMLVELTLSFPLFLAVIIGGFEVLRLSYNNVAVQILASRGVFMAGPRPCMPNTSCSNQNNTVSQGLANLAQGLGIGGPATVICIAPQSSATQCLDQTSPPNSVNLGSPRELYVVRAQRTVGLVFGLGQFTVNSLSIGRHEPGVM